MQPACRLATITISLVAAMLCSAADKPLNQTQAKLATEAHQILVSHCGKCHGKGGSYSDEMLLDYPLLIEEAFIVKGKASKSDLYKTIADSSMPPKKAKNPVSPEDLEKIKQWD